MTKLTIKEMKDVRGGMACAYEYFEWDNMTCDYCNGLCFHCVHIAAPVIYEETSGC